jgi:hypothetical protein
MNIINETSTQIDLKKYFESLGNRVLSEHEKLSYKIPSNSIALTDEWDVNLKSVSLNSINLNETTLTELIPLTSV